MLYPIHLHTYCIIWGLILIFGNHQIDVYRKLCIIQCLTLSYKIILLKNANLFLNHVVASWHSNKIPFHFIFQNQVSSMTFKCTWFFYVPGIIKFSSTLHTRRPSLNKGNNEVLPRRLYREN